MRTLWLALSLVVPFWGMTAAAEEWTMASGYPDGNFHTTNIQMFVDEVAGKSGGELEITLHTNQSLFKLPETKRAVQTGQVQLGELLLVQYGNENPFFEVSAIPMLADSYPAAEELWGLTKPLVAEALAVQGVKLLYGVPWPVQGFYSQAPLETAADVAGQKFRAYSAVTARMAEELGMIPTTIASSEIPQAFATGLVSVMYTSPQTGIDSQAWDFTQYFTNVGGNFSMNVVVASQEAFDGLDEAAQNALLEAADAAEARGWQMSQEVTAEQIATLEENGMEVSDPSAEFLAELQAVGATLTEEWLAKAGTAGADVVAKLKQQ